MIECARCKQHKPEDSFRRDGRKENGRSSYCISCSNAASLASHHKHKATKPSKLAYIRHWYANRSEEQRMVDRARGAAKNTGVSVAVVTEFLLRSPPVACCDICGSRLVVRPHLETDGPVAEPTEGLPTAHVDHCHGTGLLRGLLCSPCNSGLGLMKDDLTRVKKAAEYLEAFDIFN